ncbi:MAG: hypothetical protein LBF21_00530, partial [Puniceicoccales bacterium]|nr:hypothetical protein [Puniceicoccales bacterium]
MKGKQPSLRTAFGRSQTGHRSSDLTRVPVSRHLCHLPGFHRGEKSSHGRMCSISDRHVLGTWGRYFLLCLALALG